MESNFLNIDERHILFWNLWCLNYAFEKIAPTYTHYIELSDSYNRLWRINDNNITVDPTDFSFIQNFDDTSFDALDDFKIEELAIKEFINGADIIIKGLTGGTNRYGGKAVFTIPFNIIEILLDKEGSSVTKAEGFNQPICIQEATAQLKLSTALSQFDTRYPFADRNIYRTGI
ncbi:hypothetical protein SAMN05428949_4824 [Chitinophaga sp. YR627]|nr:hypothetical protein SAMN05428949_4824 [Chitinophaga sp. YR627]